MPQPMTREIALAAARDEGDRSMRAAGRTAWNQDDWYAASRRFNQVWANYHKALTSLNPRTPTEGQGASHERSHDAAIQLRDRPDFQSR